MITTGDKRNAFKKLQAATKSIKYSSIDFKEITVGSPKEYLKLYHYLIIDYNPSIAMEILNKYQMELQGKNDKSFIDSIYKLMRDMLNYKPPITKEQFFSLGYAEIKALMACEIIQLIQHKFKDNKTVNIKQPTLSNKFSENKVINRLANATVANTGVPTNLTPLVHNHRILNTNLPSNIKQSFSSDNIHKNLVTNLTAGFKTDENIIVKKNTILEVLTNDDDYNGLDSCETIIDSTRSTSSNSKLANSRDEEENKYDYLINEINNLKELIRASNLKQSKIQYIERINNNDDDDDDDDNDGGNYVKISVKEYENLMSRITLLENKIIIVEKQLQVFQDKNKQLLDMNSISISEPVIQQQPPPPAQQQQQQHISKPLNTRFSMNTNQINMITQSNSNKKLNNNDINVEDYEENHDDTLYGTPFVSFMNNSNDDIDTTPNKQPRVSLVTKGLLAQGILDVSTNSQNNDLTPTMDTNKNISNNNDDFLNRARSLVDRAAQFKENMTNIFKV